MLLDAVPLPFDPSLSRRLLASRKNGESDEQNPSILPLTIYPPFNVALPYNAEDDIDDLPVPDTVEDLPDDESDALSSPTPATRSPSMSLIDASARSSGRARGHVVPQVYVNADGSYFRHGLELDPLPFAHDSSNPSHMFESVYAQDC